MRILEEQRAKDLIRLRAETLDDLWELSHLINAGDSLRGRTERKVQLGTDRTNQIRKPMTLRITVEQVSLEHDTLRVQGVITEGPEDLISFGDHHSFTIQEQDEFTLIKQWDSVQRKRLERALTTKPLDILLVTFDRENAFLAELTRRGYNIIQQLSGDVTKKAPGGGSEDFWKTLAKAIGELDARKKYQSIIAASPAFWTDYLLQALPADIRKKTTTASCSAVGEAAIKEVLKRHELRSVLEQDRASTEERLVEQVLEAISKEKACYGIDECEEKVGLGQTAVLIVSEKLIETAREDGWYNRLDALLEAAAKIQTEIHLLEHMTTQLDAIGGIAGVLRW